MPNIPANKIEELNSTKEERYSELVDIDLDKVPVVESNKFDPTLYAGKKLKIDTIEIKKEIDYYPDGKSYDPKSTETMFRVYLYTEPLKEMVLIDEKADPTNVDNWKYGENILMKTDKDGNEIPVRVNCRFNLQKTPDGKPEISKAPSAKLWKFMRKIGANTLPEVKGKYVMLDVEPSKVPNDDRKYLRIVQ